MRPNFRTEEYADSPCVYYGDHQKVGARFKSRFCCKKYRVIVSECDGSSQPVRVLSSETE